jgi:hypothetical protein
LAEEGWATMPFPAQSIKDLLEALGALDHFLEERHRAKPRGD